MGYITLLAPATRIGYLLYPINFFVWSYLFADPVPRDLTASTEESATNAANAANAGDESREPREPIEERTPVALCPSVSPGPALGTVQW
jgi:hypothetical protein